MATNLQKILQAIKATAKTSHPWIRGQPAPQPYFTYRDGVWRSSTDTALPTNTTSLSCSTLSVLSWNIDFMRILPSERMTRALAFLATYTALLPAPPILMFNEMLVSDLQLLQHTPWIQDRYNLTDLDDRYWESGYYGTCMLISRALPISRVFRVHYTDTAMERDGLFVDLHLNNRTLRVCSTHLESLVAVPPRRPGQMAEAARFLREAEAGILGGDLNAIESFDRRLHADNGLEDAYLRRGGEEDAREGMTWGQMAPTTQREQFGLSRMDKLLFCGGVDVRHFETFGMDVVVDSEELRARLVREEGLEKGWVTDHLGVRGDFVLLANGRSGASL